MKLFQGRLARGILLAYFSLALVIVLISAGSTLMTEFVRRSLIVKAHHKQEAALLSARIRSETLLLTNGVQQYALAPTSRRSDLQNQLTALETLLAQATAQVDPNDIEESIAIGRVREYLIAFNSQSRHVLDTAEQENGLGSETKRQMDILLNHYQPALLQALKWFEEVEVNSSEEFIQQAVAYAAQASTVFGLISAAALAVVGVMSFWMVRRFIQPLNVLMDNVSLAPDEAMNTPVYLDTKDELGDLARALNHLRAQVNDSNYRLRQYAKNLEALVEERTRELKVLAVTDPLTGIYNRGHFFTLAMQAFAETRRNGSPFSIGIFDADHFKTINDQYGHAVGDRVLQAIVQIMKANIRQSDILGRYGGEEFVVALPNTNLEDALHIMKRIASLLSQIRFESDQRQFQITISGGLAQVNYALHEEMEDVLLKADKALYLAKEMGRDRVVGYNYLPKGD